MNKFGIDKTLTTCKNKGISAERLRPACLHAPSHRDPARRPLKTPIMHRMTDRNGTGAIFAPQAVRILTPAASGGKPTGEEGPNQ